jgi:hypothetical protein
VVRVLRNKQENWMPNMRRDHPKSSLRGAPTTSDGAIALVSSHPTMTVLRAAAAAAACTACPLYARAMQTVFGEGPEHAPLVLVGETPGDQEDRPAGRAAA